jgi:EAL domain-containing protein (putative c-di-GMP-specific phosphodiesterase class I)/PAS domain-containing protein
MNLSETLQPADYLGPRRRETEMCTQMRVEGVRRRGKRRAKTGEPIPANRAGADQDLLATALDSMSHGLLMIGPDSRILLCNRRVSEIYDMAPDAARPGMMLEELLANCVATGIYPDSTVADVVALVREDIATGKRLSFCQVLPDGRRIKVRREKLPDGKWIFMYEDVTEQSGTGAAFMDEAAQQRRALEMDLREALALGQLELHYQPLVSVAARRVSGFEALLRWQHETRGWVSPSVFVPVAEETGLIAEMGAWTIAAACAEAARWPAGVRVAVNLSPLQFAPAAGLLATVERALADSGLAPERLELEITESLLLRENEETLAILHRLRALGVSVSLDDFGTGYASLSYLRSFPFDKIKIDQSFVRDLEQGGGSEAIVRAIAGLGANLGIGTIAEGVETRAQLERLVAFGCTEMQGHLFGPARPARELGALLEAAPGQAAA